MEPEAERSLVQENTALPFFFFFLVPFEETNSMH